MRGRPHWAWYFLAIVPFAGGVALAVYFFLAMLSSIDEMDRFEVPGQAEVYLVADDYLVFAEGSGDGWRGSCAVHDADGAEVRLGAPTGRTTYTLGGRQGVSVFRFTAPRDSGYRFTCDGDRATLAIGRGIGLSLVAMILAPIGGCLLAGLTAVLVFLWRRRGR